MSSSGDSGFKPKTFWGWVGVTVLGAVILSGVGFAFSKLGGDSESSGPVYVGESASLNAAINDALAEAAGTDIRRWRE